jgi:hypothetical protein
MARGTPILTHFTGGEVSDLTDGRLDQDGYYACLSKLQNMIVTIQGPATKRPGTRFVRAAKYSNKRAWLIPFEYAAGDNYVLEFGELYIRFFTNQGCVLSGGSPYEVVTPYLEADLANIRYAQVGDVIFLVHPIYPPKQLSRLGATNWTLANIPFVWGPFKDDDERGYTMTPSATTGSITLTSSSSVFTSAWVGAQIKLTGDQVTSGTMAAGGATVGPVTLAAGETLTISLTGTWAATIYLERSYDGVTWLPFYSYTANATYEFTNLEENVQYRWRVNAYTSGTATGRLTIKDRPGYATITAYTSGTQVAATVVQTLPGTYAFSKWAESAFSAVNGYPTAIRFFEQRMLLAGSIDEPNKIYASQIDDYVNFKRGSNDSDSYAYMLAGSRVNPIMWLCDHRVLFLGTLGDEWKFGKADEATTPNAVDAKRETENGSEPIQALLVENSVVFVEAGGRDVRAITYDFDTDSYQSPRISAHADHLLKDGLIHIVFQSQPRPTIWMITDTGKLVGCTYSRANKMAAFHQHALGGTSAKVEAIAVIRSPARDEVWMIVSRTINGATARYVEFMEDEEFTSLGDAFYVDCGLSYSGAPASTFSGLDHLEGQTVKVVADGAVHAERVVTGGVISLEREASEVSAGLGYKSVLKTKRLELKGGSGSSQGKPKQIYQVTIRLYQTVTCNIGYDETNVFPVFFRRTSTLLGDPPDIFSGDKIFQMADRGTRDGYICVTSEAPAPLTVVAIVPTMYASEL